MSFCQIDNFGTPGIFKLLWIPKIGENVFIFYEHLRHKLSISVSI